MASNIERLNYYEREYLRSFDFIAEQNYHIEMRRRLNIALHLWGIVVGLDVKLGEVVEGAPPQYHITLGMAIDAYGREIFLFAPYILSEDDVTQNRITLPGRYSLFIAYKTDLATPPAPGFAVCDLKYQYTRRHESYRIIISNELDDSVDPKKAKIPSPTDDLSDDPAKKPWPIRLGSVDIDANLMITNAWPKNRTYVGVRAQRIVAPVASLGDSAPDANRPITVEADLRARKNAIVGKNFEVLKADTIPQPAIDPFPSEKGNLKVRHDLFMRGEFYKLVDAKWLALKEYVRTLMPDIHVNTVQIDITPLNPSPSLGQFPFQLASKLPIASSASIMAAIAGIEWKTRNEINTWWGNIGGADSPIVRVTADPPQKQLASLNTFDFVLNWTVGPNDTTIPNNPSLSIKSLTVSYVVVFFP
ncbi:MAG TPA: hypothetical protein VFD62_16895 [Pyrinomonadaceae bacterium]|nr:hypothetical protein [Pyrinomonadaceae bacterium]